ncbi:hypothetical protein ScalyP_jg11621 [Parmales sp. scaly parma]|nr:hypothetical protein ScalyP_jg11621 [Parmales sp. scaly parma]
MGLFSKQPFEDPPHLSETWWIQFFNFPTEEIYLLCCFFFILTSCCKHRPSFSLHDYFTCLFSCCGGSLLVPSILGVAPLNSPVYNETFAALFTATFLVISLFPLVRDVFNESLLLNFLGQPLAEAFRASAVVKATLLASSAVSGPTNVFSFPLFAPILCGFLAGAGGGFLPLSVGLSPLERGLTLKMKSALHGATFYHVFTNLFGWVGKEEEVARACVGAYFVLGALAKLGELHQQQSNRIRRMSQSQSGPLKID